jgi:hypothetical protein
VLAPLAVEELRSPSSWALIFDVTRPSKLANAAAKTKSERRYRYIIPTF